MQLNRWNRTGALLLVAALAACGNNVENEMGANAAAEAMQPAPVSEAQAAALEEALVNTNLSEWQISLSRDSISAGQITFSAHNIGRVSHALEIESADGEEWETEEIGLAGTQTLTVQLPPGTYKVYCPLETEHGNHEELGMRTTLVVR